jgi:hypothetical protein
MLTGDIGKTVREAGGASPDASGAIPSEGLFGTQTKHREQAPAITDQEAADQAAAEQYAADEAAQDQGYSYSPPQQQQIRSATYTNEDFYPGPADPAQFAFREGLQVVARPGRMPMGAIAKAAASIERKRQQTKQAKDQLYSLTQKRFAGIDPNRRKLIYEMQDKEIDKKMQEYYLSGEKQPLEGKSARTDKRVQRIEKRLQELKGSGYGEENETIKQLESKKTRLEGKKKGIQGEIASLGDEAYRAAKSNPREMDKLWAKAAKDPVFRSKLMETVRMNEATVYRYNYVYNSAKKYIEDVDDPKQSILKDPFIYDSAWKIVNPGSDATIEELAYAETEYNRAWELNAYFKENVLPTAEKLAANWNAEVQPKGSYYELTESNDWKRFVEAQKDALLSDASDAVRVWYNSKNNKGPEYDPSGNEMDEAAKEILNGFLGEIVKKSISQKPVSGGSPSGPGNNYQYELGSVADTTTVIPNPVEAYQGVSPAGSKAITDVVAVPLSMTTGGKALTPEALIFQKGGKSVEMIPFRVEMNKITNQAYVIGFDPNDEAVKEITTQSGNINDIKTGEEGDVKIDVINRQGNKLNRTIKSKGILYVPINGITKDAQFNLTRLRDNWTGVEKLLRDNNITTNPSTELPVK